MHVSSVFKQGPALYKEPWTGRAVSHFILDTELSTSPGRDSDKSLTSAITAYSVYKDQQRPSFRNSLFFRI